MPPWIDAINVLWPVFGPLLVTLALWAVVREIAGLWERRP